MFRGKLAVKFLGLSFAGLLVGLSFSLVFAQKNEVELDKIVVSAYKSEIDQKISPASSEVVSVGEANSAGEFTITDAIKNSSSVDYSTSGGIGGDTSVFIRGANSDHTQVLLEGIKLYDPISTSGYFYGYNYMSLDNIKRIEILKGPYSSLYGSGGIGGTISLITEKGKGKPELSYLQEFGAYDTYREKISSKGSLDKLAYSFSVSKLDVNSFYSAKYKNGNSERDPYHNFNSSVRLDYDFTDSLSATVLTDYAYAKYEFDAYPINIPVDSDVNWGKFYQGVGGVILKQKLTEYFSHKFTFGYTRTHRVGWDDDPSSGDSWYDGKTQQYKWEGNYALCNWDNLIFGVDYLNESGSSFAWGGYTPKHLSNTKGYYIQNSFNPIENLFLAASFRIEDHSNFGLHSTYNISGSYLFEKTGTKLKGSYGTGFKAPSLFQLYSTYYGNSNLNPEESESYEAGFEQSLIDKLKFGSTYFDTRFSNLIDSDSSTWKYYNGGKAKSFGLENFIQYDFDKNNNIKLAYTYMQAKNQETKVRLSRRPVNKFNLQAKGVLFDRLEILPEISFIGNRIDGSNKLKAYLLANLAFNYTVNDKLNTFLRFENILNKDYELVYGYQTPKFSWYLGAEYKF